MKILILIISVFAGVHAFSDDVQLNLQQWRYLDQLQTQSQQNKVAKYLPLHLHAVHSQNEFYQQLLNYETSAFANGQFVDLANTFENSMKITMKTSLMNTQHDKVDFRFDPAQGLTSIDYQGAVETKLSYNAFSQEANLRLAPSHQGRLKVAFEQKSNHEETRSEFELAYNW